MPYTVPNQIPVIGGRTFPLPGDAGQPNQQPSEDTTARQTIVDQLAAENGGLLGAAAPVNLDKPDASGNVWAGYHRYTFKNGSTLDIKPDGTVIDYKQSTQANQAAANAAGSRQHPDITDKTTGNTYTWDPSSNQYAPAPGVPQAQRPQDGATRQGVESGRNVTQTYDAASNQWRTTSVGDSAIPGTPVEGNTRQTVDAQGHPVTQTYSGGSWTNTSIGGLPQEGQTRQTVDAQGHPITQTYSNGSWTNTSIGGLPKEGQTRQTVDAQGHPITQTYSGGAWVNSGIGGLPQEGQTRQTVDAKGQPVTQTFSGGSWVNSAMPGAATEGQTRQNVQGGYNVTETYQNGGWNVTSVGGPAKPQAPTILSTGTGRTYTSWDPTTGQVTTQPNPNAADIGSQIIQLKTQANAQQQALNQQVQQGKLTPDQASAQFDQWYADTIEPQKADIAQAQATQQADLLQKQYAAARIPADIAQAGTRDYLTAATSLIPHLANANAAQLLGQAITPGGAGQGFPSVDYGKLAQASTFSMPNLQEIGRLGAAQALASFSPTAQMHLQTPGPLAQSPVGGMPGPQDLTSLLARSNFSFGGAPATAGGGGYNPNDLQWNQAALGNPIGQPGQTNVGGVNQSPSPFDLAQYQPGTYGALTGDLGSLVNQYLPGLYTPAA